MTQRVAAAVIASSGTERPDPSVAPVDSAASLYVMQCERLGVHPNSMLVSLLREESDVNAREPRAVVRPSLSSALSGTSLTFLQLERAYIGDVGLTTLAGILPHAMPWLRALSVTNSGIGNSGIASLCQAIAVKCQRAAHGTVAVGAPLEVLDVSYNSKITRVGGQSLHHACSRIHNHLAVVHVAGTKVSEYFEARIHRFAALRYDALSRDEQLQIYELCSALGLLTVPSCSPSLMADTTELDNESVKMLDEDARIHANTSVASPPLFSLLQHPLQSPLLAQLHPTPRSGSAAARLPTAPHSRDIRGGSSAQGHSPHFLVDDDGDLLVDAPKQRTTSSAGLIPSGASSPSSALLHRSSFDVIQRVESANPMMQHNAPFDEVWDADGNGVATMMTAPAVRIHSVLEMNRPSAPSGLETILYSATPDFLHVFSEGTGGSAADGLSRRYTITTMPGRERTVYGFSTPSMDEIEIFGFVDMYKPKTIELPTKFMFPGTIEYLAAVHAPDPMLTPTMPMPLAVTRPTLKKLSMPSVPAPPPVPTTASPTLPPNPPPLPFPIQPPSLNSTTTGVDAVFDDEQQRAASMFWSFFHTVGTPAGGGTPREQRTPNNPNTPRSHQPLVSENHHSVPPLQLQNNSAALHSPAPTGDAAASLHLRTNVQIAVAPLRGGETPTSAAGTPATTPEDSTLRLPEMATLAAFHPPATITHSGAGGSSPGGSSTRSSAGTPIGTSFPDAQYHGPAQSQQQPWSISPASTTQWRSKIDPLVLNLGKVNDARHDAPAMLSCKHASYPLPSSAAIQAAREHKSKSLWQLLLDPEWTPARPTRTSQITDYCASHKLLFDTVSRERKKVSYHRPREYYLQRIIRPSITDNLSAGAMNTKGNMLVTSNYDMTCKVWDLETGKKIHTLRGHTGHLSDCAWNAPICDKVITSSFDKTLKVWDVASGELLHTLRGHELEVVCVAVSSDGLECASGAMDDIAIIWDIDRGIEKFTLAGHTAEVIALDFSPVGGLLVSGSMDETVRVWSTLDGSCIRVFEGHTAEVGQAKFNCFGNIVLSGSIDGTCKLWDVKTGRHKTLRGHTHEVVDCDFSPDGWICASASDDGTVRLWDVLSGGCLLLIVGHERGVCRLAFTANGSELITGSLDTTAKVWNVGTGECKQTLRGHKGLVLVTYNAASEKILTLSRDNTCRIWKLEPELDTMFNAVAASICSDATLYNEAVSSGSLPVTAVGTLGKMYRRILRDETSALAAPLGATHNVRSPDPQEGPEEETVDTEESAAVAGMGSANTVD